MVLLIDSRIANGQYADYEESWNEQKLLHSQIVAGEAADTIILLEHASVYTAGRRTEPSDRPLDDTPVVEVDRGGKITWHGPGQIVGYPIVHLPTALDVVAHVRRLEDVLISTCAEFGLETTRIPGRSGVWVLGSDGEKGSPNSHIHGERVTQDRKLAAIGVRVAQGVTMHGFSLNCNPDLSYFDRIVPCGIKDSEVTSLTLELHHVVTPQEVLPILTKHLRLIFGPLSELYGNRIPEGLGRP